ncbi:hypothetical protein [Roseicella aerolata]|uniref:Uncharacterized protein n=1 Tax=Roseicella aerolata TaxID=2883479 RepID=A0A9X1LD13_9PROT|nr:hypothetical protein [Roseicella aerolata]MCB4824227.1 hypothetical protein [Roseicella aerolata]
MSEPPKGHQERMNTADPASRTTAETVQQDNITKNPKAKVPSDLYPDPPGVTDRTPGGRDD